MQGRKKEQHFFEMGDAIFAALSMVQLGETINARETFFASINWFRNFIAHLIINHTFDFTFWIGLSIRKRGASQLGNWIKALTVESIDTEIISLQQNHSHRPQVCLQSLLPAGKQCLEITVRQTKRKKRLHRDRQNHSRPTPAVV